MALHHLLYRCPFCGHDPLVGVKDQAECPECHRQFSRIKRGGVIRVEGAGPKADLDISELSKRIAELGGPLTAAEDAEGHLDYSSEVTLREAAEEEPVRFRGQVLGFVEQLSEGVPGVLRLRDDSIAFEPKAGGQTRVWRPFRRASGTIRVLFGADFAGGRGSGTIQVCIGLPGTMGSIAQRSTPPGLRADGAGEHSRIPAENRNRTVNRSRDARAAIES